MFFLYTSFSVISMQMFLISKDSKKKSYLVCIVNVLDLCIVLLIHKYFLYITYFVFLQHLFIFSNFSELIILLKHKKHIVVFINHSLFVLTQHIGLTNINKSTLPVLPKNLIKYLLTSLCLGKKNYTVSILTSLSLSFCPFLLISLTRFLSLKHFPHFCWLKLVQK